MLQMNKVNRGVEGPHTINQGLPPSQDYWLVGTCADHDTAGRLRDWYRTMDRQPVVVLGASVRQVARSAPGASIRHQ